MSSLSLTDDISEENFNENFEFIQKNAKIKQNEVLEPSYEDKLDIYNIVMNYIKEKKRKIYGGFALNQLFKAKDEKYKFYDDLLDEPDIDFYSPEPTKDVIEISNRLLEAGHSPIFAKEAQHKDTFKIHPNLDTECCDISYVPNNIYKNIRFIEIDGIRYIHPWFAMIDKFRVFTDPLISYRLLEKDLKRFKILDKLYPLPYISEKLQIEKYKNNEINKTLNNIFKNYLVKQENFIFSGLYCYNYYLKYSEINDNKYSYINIPYYEIYSTNYIEDAENLVKYIHKIDNLEYNEYYPLLEYYGSSIVVYYKNGKHRVPLIYLYSNNCRCVPYKIEKAIIFEDNKIETLKDKINIASFDFNILHTLINLLKVRIDNENDMNDRLYKYLNGIINFRSYYFKNTKLNVIKDDTLFQSFFSECKGKTINPSRKKKMRDALRREQNKMIEWRYDPEKPDKVNKYYFAKVSGLKIDKKEDKKLFKNYIKMDDDEKFKKFIQGEEYNDEDSSDSIDNK
jgi:hypothetical protein